MFGEKTSIRRKNLERGRKTYMFVLSSLNDMTLARICVANVHITKINVPIIFCISKMRVRVRIITNFCFDARTLACRVKYRIQHY